MSDTTQGAGNSGAETEKRAAVADRQWVDANGNEVTDPALATGFAYVDLVSKDKFVYQCKDGTAATRMLAIFGGLTKAGNIRNTAVNGPKGDPNADVIETIADWFRELDEGRWGAERAGGVGARFNKELLAQAIAQVAGQPVGSEFHTTRLARLNANEKVADPDRPKAEILYGTLALRNRKVKEAYEALVPTKSKEPGIEAL